MALHSCFIVISAYLVHMHLRDISATQDCANTLPSNLTLELLLIGEVD